MTAVRVAFPIHTFAPVRGGCETLVAGLAKTLSRRGHEVRVITSVATSTEGFVHPRRPRLKPGRDEVDGVPVVRLPFVAGPRVLRRLAEVLQEGLYRRRITGYGTARLHFLGPHLVGLTRALAAFGPDVVVCSALPFLHVLDAARWARRHRRPVMVIPAIHPHDAWSFDNPRLESFLREADALIALTDYERDYLVALGVEAVRILTLGVGIDVPSEEPLAREKAKALVGIPELDPCVLFFGRKERQKGIGELVEAHRRLVEGGRRVSLVVAGPETEWSRNEPALRAGDQPNARRWVLGEVDDAKKELLLAAADIVALPSRVDSFGIVFLEAWVRGRPVIGARTGATSSIIDDGVDGLLVEPGDVADLERSVGQLVDRPELARAYGEAGRSKALGKYTWDAMSDRFEERLRSLVAEPRPTSATASAPARRLAGSSLPRVSVVIVARNGGDDLRAAVGSAWGANPPADEVLVVDNASDDGGVSGVRSVHPRTRIVELSFNAGFAEGSNRGIRLAGGEVVLLLNQDAVLSPDALGRLADAAARRPRAGVLVPKVLVREEPRIVQSAGLVANRLLYACDRGYLELDGAEWNAAAELLGGTGAALALRREMLEQVGGFDPVLFMYYEDLDLCLRARHAGWQIAYVPEAVVLHRQRAQARDSRLDEHLDHRNRLRVAGKNLPAGTLLGMIPRELSFQARSLVGLAWQGEWVRVRRRLTGLTSAIAGIPSTIAARRRIRVGERLGDREVLALLEPGWGYPNHSPPTAAFGEARAADSALDFSPSGAESISLGWWRPERDASEGWLRWTGKFGLAFLQRPEGARALAFRVRSLVTQEMEVWWEHRRVGSIRIRASGWTEHELEIPVEPGEKGRLMLIAGRTAKPVDLGESDDRRILGVALCRLYWR